MTAKGRGFRVPMSKAVTMRRWRMGCGLVALVVHAMLIGVAGAQGTAPMYVELGVTQSANAAGRTVVAHWMATNAAGPKTHVSVYRQPGDVGCREDPRNPWPIKAEQLLFGVDRRSRSVWEPVVRTVEHRPGTWTVCAYVVNDDNPRFDMPYVITAARTTYGVAPKNTNPARRSWARCREARAGRIVNLQVDGRPTRATCQRARTLSAAWMSRWDRGAARNNWGIGWQVAKMRGVRHMPRRNAPKVRHARLTTHRGVSSACRERTTSAVTATPLVVECGPYRWRFITT